MNACLQQAPVYEGFNYNSSINIKLNCSTQCNGKRKENVKEPQVKDRVPLSNWKLQENGQCRHSTGGPLIQGPYSISHCTPPSLEMQYSYHVRLTNNYKRKYWFPAWLLQCITVLVCTSFSVGKLTLQTNYSLHIKVQYMARSFN